MDMQSELKGQLKKKYRELFERYEIDEKTGCLKRRPTLKFATYPYIGSCYGEAARILIVGLDIGKDETPERPGQPGWFQSFEERRAAIEDRPAPKHNEHIAGTYFTALFFLREFLECQEYWNGIKNTSTCEKILKSGRELAMKNPLSYITLTNYYKFVTTGRTKRAGDEDRKHLLGHFDREFFVEEVEIFNPDIVVFQGAEFKDNLAPRRLVKTGRSVYTGPHPSNREKGGRVPEYFVNRIREGKL